jgi:hypothetical protein
MSAAYLKAPKEGLPDPGYEPTMGCALYVSFDTPFAAQRAARRCGGSTKPYLCRHCGDYHVGDPTRHALGKADR